jgi:hypothetical protein
VFFTFTMPLAFWLAGVLSRAGISSMERQTHIFGLLKPKPNCDLCAVQRKLIEEAVGAFACHSDKSLQALDPEEIRSPSLTRRSKIGVSSSVAAPCAGSTKSIKQTKTAPLTRSGKCVSKGISYGLRLVNAKSLSDRLSCIARVATFVIACIDIFSQPVVLQKFQPFALTAKNKVDSQLIDSESTTEVPRIWDKRFVVYPLERPLEFQMNVQDEFFRRASILQIDFLRRAFEQSFASFAAVVVGDVQFIVPHAVSRSWINFPDIRQS